MNHHYFNLDEGWKSKRMLSNNGYLLTEKSTIYIAKDDSYTYCDRPIDYLLLTSSFSGNLHNLINQTQPKSVIIDKSMGWDRFYDCKYYLERMNYPTENIFNTGALTIRI